MHVCLSQELPKTGSGRDLKSAHVILYAIRRSTVLFSTFNFHLFLNRKRTLNSRATESKEHSAPRMVYVWDFVSRGDGSSPVAGAPS